MNVIGSYKKAARAYGLLVCFKACAHDVSKISYQFNCLIRSLCESTWAVKKSKFS